MNEQAAVRRGIPLRALVGRMLIPAACIIVTGALLLSIHTYRSTRKSVVADIVATVNTVYETHPAVHGESNGLAVLSESREFERFWILSATGDILASSRRQEVGTRLDRAWWKHLEGRSSGIVLVDVPFGSRTLMMAGVYQSNQGRWAVAVTERPANFSGWFWSIISIFALSLLALTSLGAIAWVTLRRNVASPLRELDEVTGALLRGSTVSDATLDRLWAETEPSLGGHADGVVDLVRRHIVTVRKGDESEARFRSLFDSLDGLAYIRSRDARIVAVNAELRSRLGLSREWILGNSVRILDKVLPIAPLEEWLRKAMSSSIGIRRLEVFPGEMEGVKDPIRISALPVRFQAADAHLILVEAISEIQDFDDQSSLDRERSEMNGSAPTPLTLHRAILQASDDMVLVLDEETRIVYWSPAAVRLTGWEAGDISTIGSFVRKALSKNARKSFEEWLEDEPTERTLNLSMITAGGGDLPTRWQASVVRLDDGSSYGILIGRDLHTGEFSGDRQDRSRSSIRSVDRAGEELESQPK